MKAPDVDEIRAQAQLEVYRQVAERAHLFSDECFADRALRPLDIAVLCQGELAAIQRLYESDPDQLQEQTIELACKLENGPVLEYFVERQPTKISTVSLCHACQHSQAGVISLLARARPELVSRENPDKTALAVYPLSLAMNHGAPEEDIRTLVELWPEGSTVLMYFEHTWSAPLQQCLQKGYSKDLLDFMIQSLPEKIDQFGMANDPITTAKDLGWIQRVLKTECREFTCKSLQWAGQGYSDFLGLFFLQDSSVHDLRLVLPCSLEGSNQDVDLVDQSMQDFTKKSSLQPTKTKISKLFLRFQHPAYCGLLDCLPHWPCLQELELDAHDHLQYSLSPLCQLLKQNTLQSLTISTTTATTGSRKRKAFTKEVIMPLKPLFDALTLNRSLVRLWIKGISRSECIPCVRLLIDVLQQNTTLQVVHGFHYHGLDGPTYNLFLYYLNLNLSGRKQARDTSTDLSDFVTLLGSAQSPIQYGLLQEAVSSWTSVI